MADPATPLSELMQENIVKVDVEKIRIGTGFFNQIFGVPLRLDEAHMLGIISMKDALKRFSRNEGRVEGEPPYFALLR